MILYRKVWWGLPLLLRAYGSAFPRVLPLALLSALVTLLIYAFAPDAPRTWWNEPFPFQPFSTAVAFILVFRSNYSYQRFSEGRTQLQYVCSKLLSAVTQIVSFEHFVVDQQTLQGPPAFSSDLSAGGHDPIKRMPAEPQHHHMVVSLQQHAPERTFTGALTPRSSLDGHGKAPGQHHTPLSSFTGTSLPVVSEDEWRRCHEHLAASNDAKLKVHNLSPFLAPSPPPAALPPLPQAALDGVSPFDGKGAAGQQLDGGLSQHHGAAPAPAAPWLSKAARQQHEFMREMLHLTSLLLAVSLQRLRYDSDLNNLRTFSSSQELPPEDPAYLDLQDLRDSSFASGGHFAIGRLSWMDVFMLRGTRAHQLQYNAAVPLPIIGTIKPSEAAALSTGAVVHSEQAAAGPAGDDLGVQGAHRPYVVAAWLQQAVLRRQACMGLTAAQHVPAPLLAGVFNDLTAALDAYSQCEKLADTPFPFPWAQFILALLLIHTFTVPLVVLAYVPQIWLALLLTIITTATYWALNEVARDVEDPFVYEPNDIPLANLLHEFNQRLVDIAASATTRVRVSAAITSTSSHQQHQHRLQPAQQQPAKLHKQHHSSQDLKQHLQQHQPQQHHRHRRSASFGVGVGTMATSPRQAPTTPAVPVTPVLQTAAQHATTPAPHLPAAASK